MSDRQCKPFTNITVAKLQPGDGRREVPDPGCLGLYCLVHRSGRKSWVFRYRHESRSYKLTLGKVDVEPGEAEGEPKIGSWLSLAAARTQATQARRAVGQGRNPNEERKVEKAGARRDRGSTFEWCCREFIPRYAKPRTRRWMGTTRTLGLQVNRKTGELLDELKSGGVCERWRDRPVASLTERELIAVLDEKVDAG